MIKAQNIPLIVHVIEKRIQQLNRKIDKNTALFELKGVQHLRDETINRYILEIDTLKEELHYLFNGGASDL